MCPSPQLCKKTTERKKHHFATITKEPLVTTVWVHMYLWSKAFSLYATLKGSTLLGLSNCQRPSIAYHKTLQRQNNQMSSHYSLVIEPFSIKKVTKNVIWTYSFHPSLDLWFPCFLLEGEYYLYRWSIFSQGVWVFLSKIKNLWIKYESK